MEQQADKQLSGGLMADRDGLPMRLESAGLACGSIRRWREKAVDISAGRGRLNPQQAT